MMRPPALHWHWPYPDTGMYVHTRPPMCACAFLDMIWPV